MGTMTETGHHEREARRQGTLLTIIAEDRARYQRQRLPGRDTP